MGAIQGAALDALGEAAGPMRPGDLHAAVECRLQRPVSTDTISSFLSAAARSANMPVIRTGPGLYALVRSMADNNDLRNQACAAGLRLSPTTA
jgi:hypothetical protein